MLLVIFRQKDEGRMAQGFCRKLCQALLLQIIQSITVEEIIPQMRRIAQAQGDGDLGLTVSRLRECDPN